MDYMYNPGERVIVRRDLKYKQYNSKLDARVSNTAVADMVSMAGLVVTIKTCENGQYRIEENERWRWVDSMFEGLEDDYRISASAVPLEQLLYRK